MNTVIQSVREIISQKGMKQCAVAKKAGFTPQEFSNILCGKKVFKTEYIMPICNALGVYPNDLFTQNTSQETER